MYCDLQWLLGAQDHNKKILEWQQHIAVKQQHWGGRKKGQEANRNEKSRKQQFGLCSKSVCACFHPETKLVLHSFRIWQSHRSSPQEIQVVLITHSIATFQCLLCKLYNCCDHRACSVPSSTTNLVTDHKFASSRDPAQAWCGHAPIFCTIGNHFT